MVATAVKAKHCSTAQKKKKKMRWDAVFSGRTYRKSAPAPATSFTKSIIRRSVLEMPDKAKMRCDFSHSVCHHFEIGIAFSCRNIP